MSRAQDTDGPLGGAFIPADEVVRASLAHEATRLLGLLKARFPATVMAGMETVFGAAPAKAGSTGLGTAREALRGRLGAFPLANLLAHLPGLLEPRAADLDRLRGWVLAGMLDAIGAGLGHHTTKDRAAANISLLCRATDHAPVRQRTPTIPADALASVLDVLAAWGAAERAIGSGFAGNLYHVELTLRQLAGQPRWTNEGGERSTHARTQALLAGLRLWAAVPARDDLALSHDCTGFDVENETLENTEDAADVSEIVAIRTMVEVTDLDVEFVAGAEAMAAETALFEADHPVLTGTACLTAAEAIELRQALEREIRSDAAPAGLVLLAVSLLTGRTLRALCAMSRGVPKRAGTSWWARGEPRQLGERIGIAFCAAVTDAPKPPGNGFVLVLPGWLQEPLCRILAAENQPDAEAVIREAQNWLDRKRSVSAPVGRSARIRQVAGAVPAALTAMGTDAAIWGMLLGADIRVVPQAWYSRIPVETLDSSWRRVLADWLGETAADVSVIRSGRATAVGSCRIPEERALARFFSARREALATAERTWPGRPGWAELFHGRFIDQCVAVLLAATARRPHGLIWPLLSCTLKTGAWPQVRLHDKGNRLVDDARWLPLPPVAVETLAALEEHLHNLRDWGRLVDPSIAAAADAALSGNGPLFWRLPENGGKPVPLTCAAWWADVPSTDLKRNSFRHFWRTRLLADGLPGWMIDQWMGHGGWQNAQFLPMGASSAADLAPIAVRIEPILRALGASPPVPRRMRP